MVFILQGLEIFSDWLTFGQYNADLGFQLAGTIEYATTGAISTAPVSTGRVT